MKKITSVTLIICIISSLLTLSSISVLAANYSTNSAMQYAQKHWNDGVGKCAEFVSKCVKAGGLNISIKTGTKGCWDAILNASGLSGKNLTLDSKGYVTKSNNSNILNRGDVVIQWCYTCDLRPHILICGGYDSSGYATFYAHNSALNNGRYKFSTNSQHKSSCNIGAKVVQLSKLSSTTASVKKPTINVTSYPTNIKKGKNFGLRGYINTNGGTTEISAYITNPSARIVQKAKVEKTNFSKFDISFSNANTQLFFNKLSKGDYCLVISAKNSAGTTTFSKKFKVK